MPRTKNKAKIPGADANVQGKDVKPQESPVENLNSSDTGLQTTSKQMSVCANDVLKTIENYSPGAMLAAMFHLRSFIDSIELKDKAAIKQEIEAMLDECQCLLRDYEDNQHFKSEADKQAWKKHITIIRKCVNSVVEQAGFKLEAPVPITKSENIEKKIVIKDPINEKPPKAVNIISPKDTNNAVKNIGQPDFFQ